MLKILNQPIVNILTGETVLVECLSRPSCSSINDYFSTEDRNTLLRRELHAILQSIEQSGCLPYNVNVTVNTLPFLSRLPFSWNGGIEIVEWETSVSPYLKKVRKAIKEIQAKGLLVWADDVNTKTMERWVTAEVDGLKVEIDELRDNRLFVEQLKATKKPIIVERIETLEDHKLIRKLGITLAQGFYYGRPSKHGNAIIPRLESLA